jgi:mRNA-degrading endonuclease RelE of RelBE toxin-antitoxin system
MSATEIIEQIKKLPRQEQEQVFAFLKGLGESEAMHDEPGVRYMYPKKAKAVSSEIFSEHAGLFRKLAG